ncbi:hypothetical protein ACPCG0_09475 [Propionibacteriaceae bacterium Y1923]
MTAATPAGPEVLADGSSTAPGGRTDDGTPLPRIIAHPELLDAGPLPPLSTGRWKLVVAALPAVVLFVIGLLMGGSNWTMAVVGVGFWLFMALLVWMDRRALLHTEADTLVVRNVLATRSVSGAGVQRVVHQFNGRSPDFQLVTTAGKVWVPTSRLERGHSTLFSWLDVHAPQAVLDPKATRWRQALVDEGHL